MPVNAKGNRRGAVARAGPRCAAVHRVAGSAAATRWVARSHPVLLTGMLRNLIRNAIDYTPAGGGVFVTARRCGSELRIEVRDTGVGIRASALPTIFRAFQRADETRLDGLGLGLFIVKHAADLLGHRVEVRSTENHGSCFTIIADAARCHMPAPSRLNPNSSRRELCATRRS